jgi:WD40 repeat protein
MWETDTGKELDTLSGHEDSVTCSQFSSDGRHLATSSLDGTVKLWDSAAMQELDTLNGQAGSIRSVAFSPDSRRIVTGNDDGTLGVWDVAMRRNLLGIRGQARAIHAVTFSPDGRTIVSGSAKGTVTVWQVPPESQIIKWEQEDRTADQSLTELAQQRGSEEAQVRAARAGDVGRIKTWLILAAIPLRKGESDVQGLERQQVPLEATLKPRAGDKVVLDDGQELIWDEVDLADSVVEANFRGWRRQFGTREVNFADTDYVIDFNHLMGEMTEKCVGYAVCYLRAEAEMSDLRLLVGSDDDSKIYLNGTQIYECPQGRSMIADADKVKDVNLRKGLNVLVFKVVNQGAGWQGSVRFTDKGGNPVKGISVTLTPE